MADANEDATLFASSLEQYQRLSVQLHYYKYGNHNDGAHAKLHVLVNRIGSQSRAGSWQQLCGLTTQRRIGFCPWECP